MRARRGSTREPAKQFAFHLQQQSDHRVTSTNFDYVTGASSAGQHVFEPAHQLSICRDGRSEEHTSELQSRLHLVCRLLLEKKKKIITTHPQRHAIAGSS